MNELCSHPHCRWWDEHPSHPGTHYEWVDRWDAEAERWYCEPVLTVGDPEPPATSTAPPRLKGK
jgi:hypothetical protein